MAAPASASPSPPSTPSATVTPPLLARVIEGRDPQGRDVSVSVEKMLQETSARKVFTGHFCQSLDRPLVPCVAKIRRPSVVILPEENETWLKTLGKREKDVLDLLKSRGVKNVVQAIAGFQSGPAEYCIVEELYPLDLSKHNALHGPLSLQQTAKYANDLLIALSGFIKARCVHVDIKRENILLSPDRAVLSDLEGAKIEELPLSKDRHRLSWQFVAPEIVLGLSPSCPADIWSLGIALLEASTLDGLVEYTDDIPPRGDQRYIDLFHCCISLLGNPPKEWQDALPDWKRFFKGAVLKAPPSRNLKLPTWKTIKHLCIKNASAKDTSKVDPFIFLLKRMLQWDPKKRITPDDARKTRFVSLSPAECVHKAKPMAQERKEEKKSGSKV